MEGWWVRVNINDANSVYDPDRLFPCRVGRRGCNFTLLSQSPVCVHWNQHEFGHQFQGEQEWGLNSLCNHVCNCFFSILSSKGRTASWRWDSAKSSTSVTPRNLRMGALRHTSDFSQWKPSVPPFLFPNRYLIIFPVSEVWKNQLRIDPWFFFQLPKMLQCFKPLLLRFYCNLKLLLDTSKSNILFFFVIFQANCGWV